MVKRKLGRGLDMLIPRDGPDRAEPPPAGESGQQAPEAGPAASSDGPAVVLLDPLQIAENPHQPRQSFGVAELEALKSSISKEGVLQPLLVRLVGGAYQLVAGERRLRACRDLGLDHVPVILADVADDRLLEVALVENIHRADLNPLELAGAYRDLMDLRGWTQEKLAGEIGIGRTSISNSLRLLELPQDVQNAVVRSQITMGHAKVLLSVDEPGERRRLFEKIAEENLSVRDTELARDGGDGGDGVSESPDEEPDDPAEPGRRRRGRRGSGDGGGRKSANIVRLEEELMEALGTRVTIRLRGKRAEKGVLSVSFDSRDDFHRLRSLLLGGVEA